MLSFFSGVYLEIKLVELSLVLVGCCQKFLQSDKTNNHSIDNMENSYYSRLWQHLWLTVLNLLCWWVCSGFSIMVSISISCCAMVINTFTSACWYLFKTLCHCFHWSPYIFYLICRISLSMLDISTLSDKYFENISFQSVACLLPFF